MDQNTETTFEDMIGPWIGMGDNDASIERFRNFDPTEEDILIKTIESDLLPNFIKMSTEEKIKITELETKLIRMSKYELNRQWESILPPFDLPNNPHQFFRTIIKVFRKNM